MSLGPSQPSAHSTFALPGLKWLGTQTGPGNNSLQFLPSPSVPNPTLGSGVYNPKPSLGPVDAGHSCPFRGPPGEGDRGAEGGGLLTATQV